MMCDHAHIGIRPVWIEDGWAWECRECGVEMNVDEEALFGDREGDPDCFHEDLHLVGDLAGNPPMHRYKCDHCPAATTAEDLGTYATAVIR